MVGVSNLKAMFPVIANDIAFMNSVVLGTSANSVTPRNFSSIPEPSRTTSTTSTSISEADVRQTENWYRKPHLPAIIAYNAVHPNNTLALVVRLQLGASWP